MDKRLKLLIRNSKYLSVEALQKEVGKIISSYHGYGTSVWNHFEPFGLYRARQHNHLEGNFKGDILNPFISELEFWNTPSEFCPLGRCNNKNESIFYCTNEFEVAIQEIKSNQEYITVSSFRPKPIAFQNQNSTAIPIGIGYLSQLPSLERFFPNYKFKSKEFKELDDFLNNLFYIDVTDEKSHLYKLSTAVTKNMMSPIRKNNRDTLMQGLVYSSMARDKKGFNVVFRPEHVVNNYYLYGVQTHRVLENTKELIRLQLLRNGHPEHVRNNMDESYNINWFPPLDNGEIYEFEKRPLKNKIS